MALLASGMASYRSMRHRLNARQQELVDLAGRLADSFAQRAAEHDRESTFPFENYDEMREAGYLGLTIPQELGGHGADLREVVLAQERLAMGCSSTALAVGMHVSPLGQVAALWRLNRDERLGRFLREAATGEVVYASMTAERGHSILMTSNTVATRVPGGYRVTGDKIFGTESAVCTHFSTMARLDDPHDGSRVLLFRLARPVEGMEVKDMWDTMGMRGTLSNDYSLRDVFVPEEAVFHSYPVGHFDSVLLRMTWSWAMPAFGAVYLGIAAGAMAHAREQVAKRGREGDPAVQAAFAEMEILLETARAVLWRHTDEVISGDLFEQFSVQEGMARSVLAKHVPCNNAIRIVDLALEVVGGAGYFRRSPLERMYRDVRAGVIMPYNNPEARSLFGRNALGIEIAPEVPAAESGHRSAGAGAG
jgi:alkylation response protein AidB-like acyl-CoA dehydrogenase